MPKYRRIKFKSVVKYGSILGVNIIPIILLFVLLSQRGDITITGYSGDVVCAGTELDPCYAYINFTANTDIYIYPNESWMFSTNPPIKKVILQRRWGDTWRTINLSRPWNSRVKYAVKFSKGKSYQIRFVGYKFNPYQDVKWGFGEIDPVWFGVKQETFFVNDSNNATIKMYRISFNRITLTTRANTKCYWNASEKYRRCVQDVVIENGLSPTALDFSNFKYSFQTDRMKDMKISFPNILSEGNNTIRFEFLYPPNTGEEWNLSFRYGDYEWKIDPTISGCSDIVSSGDYYLDTDIIDSSTSYCINISANNVNFYCNEHTIDGNDNADYGIYIWRSSLQDAYVLVKNCTITDWDTTAIYSYRAKHNTFEHINMSSNPDQSIYFYQSWYGAVKNITINSTKYGIYDYSSYYLNYNNNTFNDIYTSAVQLSNSFYGNFYNLRVYDTLNGVLGGVSSTFENITIKNCSNICMQNSGSSNTFNNIKVYGASGAKAFYFTSVGDNNEVKNSVFQSPNYAIYISSGATGNTIFNNLINGTIYFGADDSNNWNTTKQEGTRTYSAGNYIGGNYYTNSANNGYSDTCEDADYDGFCDKVYDIYNNTWCEPGVNCSNNVDYLPLSDEYISGTPISDCINITVSGEYYLNQDITYSSTSYCINISANNVVLNCQWHKVGGDDSAKDGIYVYRSSGEYTNITIENCTVSDWYGANIYFYNANNNTLKNINTYSSAYGVGVALQYSNSNKLINITATSHYYYGIQIWYSSSNIVKDSIIQDNGYSFSLYQSEANKIYNCLLNDSTYTYLTSQSNEWNTTKQLGTRIYSSGNYIGGNYYTNSTGNGFSDTCTDSNHDGFCDSPYDVVHGDTDCSDTYNCDYLPYSDEYSAGAPDLNLSFGPPSTYLFRWAVNDTGSGCGPDYTSIWVEPRNQTDSTGIFWLCNNGTVSGDVKAKLSATPNTGWDIGFTKDNSSALIDTVWMTTTYQTIYTNLGVDECIYTWAYANCTQVSANPGVSIEFTIE